MGISEERDQQHPRAAGESRTHGLPLSHTSTDPAASSLDHRRLLRNPDSVRRACEKRVQSAAGNPGEKAVAALETRDL